MLLFSHGPPLRGELVREFFESRDKVELGNVAAAAAREQAVPEKESVEK